MVTTQTAAAAEMRSGNVSATTDGTVTRIWIEGVLDALTVPHVRAALDGLVERKPPQVVVDLSRLRIIDGHGVRVIAHLYAQLRENGCALSVLGADQQPLAMLKLFQLDRVLGS
ncbi:MAG TPA: STAS domain-containing protein [Polyangia bacterium]|nr:STAS domain-containing protein [Polyangia bacterium]